MSDQVISPFPGRIRDDLAKVIYRQFKDNNRTYSIRAIGRFLNVDHVTIQRVLNRRRKGTYDPRKVKIERKTCTTRVQDLSLLICLRMHPADSAIPLIVTLGGTDIPQSNNVMGDIGTAKCYKTRVLPHKSSESPMMPCASTSRLDTDNCYCY